MAIFSLFLSLAPVVLFGFFVAGMLHVFVSERAIVAMCGEHGWKGVIKAALFGVPLPLCSCSVVPVAIELEKKGASRPAVAAFLITTPETGVDSIMLTYTLMGPFMAFARVASSIFSAICAGFFAIAYLEEGKKHSKTAIESSPQKSFGEGLSYGFFRLGNDILPSLFLGLVITWALLEFLPQDLGAYGVEASWMTYFVMVLIGAPIYVCASAMTPVAATLIFKGLSPGAALVFLLAGAGSNAASLTILARYFGLRFVLIYFFSMIFGALVCGALLDVVIGAWGLTIPIVEVFEHSHDYSFMHFASAGVLMLLAVRAMTIRFFV